MMSDAASRVRRALVAACCLVALCAAPARADDLRVYVVDKKNYVLLRDLALVYGAKVAGPVQHQVALLSKWNNLQFWVDKREARVNDTVVWLHEPMTVVRGHHAIREIDARSVIDPLIRPLRHMKEAGYRVVVIDPGHGGQDAGARGARGVLEKTQAFDIARRVQAHLVKSGFEVHLTRESDRFIELDQRAERAKRWGADLFVSIHLNSAKSDASGSETYTMTAAGYLSTSGGRAEGATSGNRFDALNSELAYQVQRAMTTQAQTVDRGVRRARFVVLKHAPCPAVLVETGFLSNRKEEARFTTEKFREELALGIARGVYNYAQLVRMARGVQPAPTEPAMGPLPPPSTDVPVLSTLPEPAKGPPVVDATPPAAVPVPVLIRPTSPPPPK